MKLTGESVNDLTKQIRKNENEIKEINNEKEDMAIRLANEKT